MLKKKFPPACTIRSHKQSITEPRTWFFNVVFHKRSGSAEDTNESYADTLAAERRRMVAINGSRMPVNEGLLAAGQTIPHCAVMDALTGEYRPLKSRGGAHSGVRPTVILFWSSRCRSSQKYLGWFVKYAKSHVSQARRQIFSIVHRKQSADN